MTMAMAMDQHCPKWSQMVPNGSKLSTMIQPSPKWSNMVPDCPKCSQRVKHCQKKSSNEFEMGPKGSIWS